MLIWLFRVQDVYRFLLLLYARRFCSFLVYPWTFHRVHAIPDFLGIIYPVIFRKSPSSETEMARTEGDEIQGIFVGITEILLL